MALTVALLAGATLAPAVALAATPGTLVSSFGSGGIATAGANTRFFATAAQSDGKVIAVGETNANSTPDLLVERFTASGAPDGSFGSGGVASGPAISGGGATGSLARAVAIQGDGKIVVVGSASGSTADGGTTGGGGLVIERFSSSGHLDTGFGHGGVVTALTDRAGDGYGVAIQGDGKIVAAGSAYASGSGGTTPHAALVRVTSSGGLDGSFGSGGVDLVDLGAFSYAFGVALQKDGKIVIAGSQAPGLQVPNAILARLNTNGQLDSSFASGGVYAHQYSPAGGANSGFGAVAVQPNGAIVAGGAAVSSSSTDNAIVARFTSGGTPDGSFGSGGVATRSSASSASQATTQVPGVRSLLVLGNGDIVAAGDTGSGVATTAVLWAFTSSGAADSRFGSGGTTQTAHGSDFADEFAGVAAAPDGSLVAAGDAQAAYNGAFTGIVARYSGFGAVVPPPPAFKAALSGLASRYKISRVNSKGVGFRVSCTGACTVKGVLKASAGVARALHIKTTFKQCKGKGKKRRCKRVSAYRALTLATVTRKLGKAGATGLTVRPGSRFRGSLGRQHHLTLTLVVTVTSKQLKHPKTFTRTITLAR